MDETAVVTVFLRNESEVLLLERSDEVGSYAGRWGAVAGHAEGDPDGAAREEIAEETGLDPETQVSIVRRGEAFPVADEALGTRWRVHPYLFETQERSIEPNWETAAWEWVPPTDILRRETVPEFWTSYDRVRPTVATVADDREHGSSWLSIRALEVLRDEAALGTTDRADAPGPAGLRETAGDLVDARPAMPVLRNRVDRAMHEATRVDRVDAGDHDTRSADGNEPSDGPAPAALEAAATAGIERARRVDEAAAGVAADRIAGVRVATLSRSGTVRAALTRKDPEAVLVSTSRPGGEGVDVAADLSAEGLAVTLTSDAALPAELARWSADVLLVGADAVLPDGHVVNKVGTRGAAIAAAQEGVDVLVVASTDKVDAAVTDPAAVDREPGAMGPLAERADGVTEANPTFDVTPPALVDALLTEEGALAPGDVEAVVAAHRERAAWRGGDGADERRGPT